MEGAEKTPPPPLLRHERDEVALVAPQAAQHLPPCMVLDFQYKNVTY